MCEICSKLTIKTPGQRHRHSSSVCIINDEQISHLVFLVFIVDFDQVIACWDNKTNTLYKQLLQCMKKEQIFENQVN